MRPDLDRLIPAFLRRHAMLRALLCVGSIAVGAFVVLGCLLALGFEADGLGRPPDTGMRPGYVAVLIIGATAGVVVPAAICLALLKGSRRLVAVLAGFAAIVVAVSLFGVVRW
jgi:hypothetical protein